ncbi:MAG: hypothetical protein WC805_01735 [Patescibacteria group bacterium]|jgi:hypothetical protein
MDNIVIPPGEIPAEPESEVNKFPPGEIPMGYGEEPRPPRKTRVTLPGNGTLKVKGEVVRYMDDLPSCCGDLSGLDSREIDLLLEESGGGHTNTGEVWLVAGSTGEALVPGWATNRGYACAGHALFHWYPHYGDVIICHLRRWRDEWEGSVQLWGWTKNFPILVGELKLSHAQPSGWLGDVIFAESYAGIVASALEKSRCYHCREAHFVASKLILNG